MNFLRFFLTLYLFFLSGNLFSKFSENEKGLTSGTHRSATASPGVAPGLAVVGGTACHHVRGHKGLTPTAPVRATPCPSAAAFVRTADAGAHSHYRRQSRRARAIAHRREAAVLLQVSRAPPPPWSFSTPTA
jgi:hypothetical protein